MADWEVRERWENFLKGRDETETDKCWVFPLQIVQGDAKMRTSQWIKKLGGHSGDQNLCNSGQCLVGRLKIMRHGSCPTRTLGIHTSRIFSLASPSKLHKTLQEFRPRIVVRVLGAAPSRQC